jgi:AcrR family transcriptional regulator
MYTMSTTRRPLTRERILDAALDLIDRDGLEGLSMRSLASSLGVVAMAPYKHFANKGELVDALIDRIASSIAVPPPSSDWRSTTASIARAIRDGLAAHPGLAQALVNRPSLGAASLQLAEALYAALHRAGFALEDLEPAANAVFTYTLGFAALEGPRRSPAGSAEPALHVTQAQLDEAYADLDPQAFPLSARVRPAAGSFISTDQFEWGLETLLDGLERRRSGGR